MYWLRKAILQRVLLIVYYTGAMEKISRGGGQIVVLGSLVMGVCGGIAEIIGRSMALYRAPMSLFLYHTHTHTAVSLAHCIVLSHSTVLQSWQSCTIF